MSNFPNELDTDVELPSVSDNITEIGGEAINALKDAIINIESTIGINPYGTTSSIANFLSVSHNFDGTIRPSAIASMGLVVLPIVDSQISATAGIVESKLNLDHKTSDLFNFIQEVNSGTQISLNFITNHGAKIEPHIQGTNFRHLLNHIDISNSNVNFFRNRHGIFRDNTNLYNLTTDINNDIISHEVANGEIVSITNGTQSGGTVPPTNYAHVAAGIFINTNNFAFIPQTATDLQQFAQFLDNSNIFILGTRIQTLYQNGIPRTARASSLSNQERGQLIISATPAVTYLLYGGSNSPVDDIDHGDDLVEFLPDSSLITNNSFDAKFSLVKIGDILTVNYGSFTLPYVIKEKKYIVNGLNKRYVVRIGGKNLASQSVIASIDKPLFNNEKSGVLCLAQANHKISGALPTLISANPRGAEVLSVGFNPSLIDSKHYNLYIIVYPNGDPTSIPGFNLPAIDISGNFGANPGSYTLSDVVENINNNFRSPGFNNRLIAFEYQGELGIKMTDSINNISFSVVSGIIDQGTGFYNNLLSTTSFPNNVIGVPGFDSSDASGLGPTGANVASPSYSSSFSTPSAAQTPTKIFPPLTRKTFYVNGVERERFSLEPHVLLDGYGDGYWPATIITKTIIPGTRVEVTYQVPLNLCTSHLQIGKTITVIPENSGGTFVDAGRFFISNITFNNCNTNSPTTNITVYDAIQSPNGITPYLSSNVGLSVRLYFSSDSISFNRENISDATAVPAFKRYMEVYVNEDGYTYSLERARMNITGSTLTLSASPLIQLYSASNISNINIIQVSPKLRGYSYSQVNKINLQIFSYDSSTGSYDGYLCQFDGITASNIGPFTIGKKGEVTRFYDQTNVNYIDLLFDIKDSVSTFTNQSIDIQLFATLSLDEEVMLLGSVQVNDITQSIRYLKDLRQFGNVSEKQFSTSAIDFIQLGDKYLHQNGVIKGFDIISISNGTITINGGTALVDGKIVNINNEIVTIPKVKEIFSTIQYNINWILCVNSNNEFILIPSTDYDAALATPNASDRVMSVINVVNSSIYSIDSITFSNLVSSRKDLTPLYIIASTVSGSGGSATISLNKYDSRKFVIDENSFIEPTLTDKYSQGNFKTLESSLTWFKFNSLYQNNLNIKSNTFEVDSNIQLPSGVLNINGNGLDSTLNFNTTSNITNVNINDISLIFGLSSLVTFDNCKFKNCNITINKFFTATSCKFIDCTFMINSDIGVNIQSNTSFESCNISYTYDATVDGYFTSTNLVNCVSSKGALSANFSNSTGQNIKINKCNFTTTTSNRFPLISIFEVGDTSFVENIIITENNFYSSTSTDDIRAVIAILGGILPLVSNTNEGSKLVNSQISKNYCDKNQMIYVGGIKEAGKIAPTNAINTVNVNIDNNICGAIMYLNQSNLPRNTINLSSLTRDKDDCLLIENNTCHIIGMAYDDGKYRNSFLFGSEWVGSSTIRNNTLNWYLGYLSNVYDSSSLITRRSNISITNNKFLAYDQTTYLPQYWASPPALNIACYIQSYSGFSSVNRIKINENIFTIGAHIADDLSTQTLYYYDTCINFAQEAIISNNIFDGCLNTSGTGQFISCNSPATITENRFYRYSQSILAYISANNNQLIATDNFFDQSTIDGTIKTVVSSTSASSTVIRNKNQIDYVAIPFADMIINPSLAGNHDGSGNITTLSATTSPTTDVIAGPIGTDTYFQVKYDATLETNAIIGFANIDKYLPKNVQILHMVQGYQMKSFASGGELDTSNPNNGIHLTVLQDRPSNFTYNSFSNSLADVVHSSVVGQTFLNSYVSNLLINAGNVASFTTTTLYNKFDFTSSNLFTGLNGISARIESYFMPVTSAQVVVVFSPILIEFMW